MWLTADRLKLALERMHAENPRVRVMDGDPGRFLAAVVSSSFEGMDDGERQSRVWDHVLKTLTDQEQRQVEFIFTVAPSEEEAAAAPTA